MAKNNQQKNPPQNSSIEKLPEDFRKRIFWLTLTILTLIVFFSWLIILPSTISLNTAEQKEEQSNWQKIISDLSLMFEKSKEGLEEINQTLKNFKTATSTDTNLSTEDILKIKEKIIEKETADWLTFQNQFYNYQLKYPNTWTLATSTSKTDPAGLVVRFSSGVNIQNPYQTPDLSAWSLASKETIGMITKQSFKPSDNASSTAGLMIAYWNQGQPSKSGLITFQYSDKNDPNLKTLDLIISTIQLSNK